METTYGRFRNDPRNYGKNILVTGFVLAYIAVFLFHWLVLHPIPAPAEGNFNPTVALEEYQDATLLWEAVGSQDSDIDVYVLGQEDGSREILLFDRINDRRKHLQEQSVEPGCTGEVTLTFLGGEETLVFAGGEVSELRSTGELWIHKYGIPQLLYCSIALVLSILAAFLRASFTNTKG